MARAMLALPWREPVRYDQNVGKSSPAKTRLAVKATSVRLAAHTISMPTNAPSFKRRSRLSGMGFAQTYRANNPAPISNIAPTKMAVRISAGMVSGGMNVL